MKKNDKISQLTKDLGDIHMPRKGGAYIHPTTQAIWIGMGKKPSYQAPSKLKVAVLTGVSWGLLKNNFLTNWWYGKPKKLNKNK